MRKVKIGKKKYTIRHVERVDDMDSFGECDFTRRRISISKKQTAKEEANTILHEILHAICDERRLGLKRDVEEEVVTELTNGIQEFLRANPGFGRRLMERLGEG